MIDQWLELNFNPVLYASGGQEKRINCPFCEARHDNGADRKQHMYVSMVKQVAHCFRCGWTGTQIDLVMNVTGCNYMEALIAVEQPKPNIGLFAKATASPRGLIHLPADNMPPGFVKLTDPSVVGRHEAISVMNYLRRRNLPHWLIDRSFGMVPGTNRAWIIIDRNYWQARSIIGSVEPKYLNPPWDKGDALWNWQALNRFEEIIICEGVFGSIAVGENAVGLMGKSATSAQVIRLALAQPKLMTIILDKGAELEATKLAQQLVSAGFKHKLQIHWLEQGQPDDGLSGVVEEWNFAAQVLHQFDVAV